MTRNCFLKLNCMCYDGCLKNERALLKQSQTNQSSDMTLYVSVLASIELLRELTGLVIMPGVEMRFKSDICALAVSV